MNIKQDFEEDNLMEKINLRSTSRDTLEVDDIILRETSLTRLIFKPLIVNNSNDKEAPIKGCFVFQRKSQSQKWEGYNKFPLNRLKGGEGVKLELKSGEIKKLLDKLPILKSIYERHGIILGKSQVYITKENIEGIIHNLSNFKDKDLLIQLLKISINTKVLHLRFEVTNIKRQQSTKKFKEMLDKELSEQTWQKWFKENNWVLGTEFVEILSERAIDPKNISDYLAKAYDGFVDIIEIKRPSDKLPFWAIQKDHDNFIPSSYLIKAIMQATNYIYEVERESNSQKFLERVRNIKVIKPRCTLIFGRSNKWGNTEKEAYRILNSSYHNLTILTYDHVLSRAKKMLGLSIEE